MGRGLSHDVKPSLINFPQQQLSEQNSIGLAVFHRHGYRFKPFAENLRWTLGGVLGEGLYETGGYDSHLSPGRITYSP